MRNSLWGLWFVAAVLVPLAGCSNTVDKTACTTVECSGVCCGDGETCVNGTCMKPCTPETDADFCVRLAKNCGPVDAVDNCGAQRSANCGTCTGTGETCTADGRCECDPRSDAQLCADNGAVCGQLTVKDSCGQDRTVASCGSCTGTGELCTEQHQCVCTPKSDAALCQEKNANCGTLELTDNCGATRTVGCGTCTGTGEECSALNRCVCTPKTEKELCDDAGAICGALSAVDNCGVTHTITSCGSCTGTGEGCEANRCVCHPESDAQLCEDTGAQCGVLTVNDTCGALRTVTTCGACSGTGEVCTANNRCLCTPKTEAQLCADAHVTCGAKTVTDNCGQSRAIVSCGSCTGTGQSCESGGCVCHPATEAQLCAQNGLACGAKTVTDNCGASRALACGTCTGTGEVCTAQNRCVCTPKSDAQLCTDNSLHCGRATVTDNCGAARSVGCGQCSGTGEVCTAQNQCVCTPKTAAQLCADAGAACGSITATDNCGVSRTVGCGSCTGPGQSCSASNQCVCTPKTDTQLCTDGGLQCGFATVTDNCGGARNIACGLCTGTGEVCTAQNHCVCTPKTDAQLCLEAGANCDTLTRTDNCGVSRTLACGSCTGPGQVCNTTSHTCQCPRQTDAQVCLAASKQCGPLTATDACNFPHTIAQCGPCTAGEVCTPSQQCLLCTPETDAQYCLRLGRNCGTVSADDNCGVPRAVACGSCLLPKQCGSNNICAAPGTVPANDECAGAEMILFGANGAATVSGDTTYARNNGGAAYGCQSSSGGNDVVYAYTLGATKNVSVLLTPSAAMAGTSNTTILTVRRSCNLVSSEVGCTYAATPGLPKLDLVNQAPGTYYVWVDSTSSSTKGPFTLTVTTSDPPAAPSNDTCAAASPLIFTGYTATATGTTVGATDNESATGGLPGSLVPTGTAASGPDVVYSFSLASAATVTARVTRPDSDNSFRPWVSVRSGCALATEVSGGTWTAASTSTSTLIPNKWIQEVTGQLAAGTYVIVVDGLAGTAGGFTLDVAARPAPTNTTCATAQALTFTSNVATVNADTSLAPAETLRGGCQSSNGKELIYSFTTTTAQGVDMAITGATARHQVYLRPTCASATGEIACGYPSVAGASFTVSAPNVAAGTYYVIVDGWGGSDNGPFTLTVTLRAPTPVPANDTCATAQPIALDGSYHALISGSTFGATNAVVGNGSCATTTSPDVVYALTLGSAANVTAKATRPLSSAAFAPAVYIITSTTANCGAVQAAEQKACGTNSSGVATATASALAAGTYYIVVDGYGATTSAGDFTLDVTAVPTAQVGTCTAATALTFDANNIASLHADVNWAGSSATSGACNSGSGKELVYSFTTTAAKNIDVLITPDLGVSPLLQPAVMLRTAANCSSTTGELGCRVAANPGDALSAHFANIAAGDLRLFVDSYSSSYQGPFAVSVALTDPPTAPTNSSCTTPQALSFVSGTATATGDTALAASDVGQGSCRSGTTAVKDLVYSFTLSAPSDVDVQVTPATTGSLYKLITYVRSDCPTSATELGCGAATTAGGTAKVSLRRLLAGTYSVFVDGYSAASDVGPFTLKVTQTATGVIPANDTCTGAPTLAFDGNGHAIVNGDTGAATDNYLGSCSVAATPLTGPDLVYKFVLANASAVAVKVTREVGSIYRPALYLRTSCETPSTEVASSCKLDSTGTGAASAYFGSLAAGTYYLFVDTVGATGGRFGLDVFATTVNDDCASAKPLAFTNGWATATGDLNLATSSTNGSCSTTANANDVVYSFTTTARKSLDLDLEAPNADFQPVVYLRSVCSDATSEKGCAAAASGVAFSYLRIPLLEPGTWYLWVDTASSTSNGAFVLSARLSDPPSPAPANDSCTGALALAFDATTGKAPTATGDTSYAGNDSQGTCAAAAGPYMSGGDVVYSFTLAQDSALSIALKADPSTPTYYPAFYLRSTCTSGAAADEKLCVTNTTSTSVSGSIKKLVAGTYFVVVDGVGGSGGRYSLDVTRYPAVDNDNCGAPFAAKPLVFDSSGYTEVRGDLNMYDQTGDGSCNAGSGYDAVYSFTLTTAMTVKFQEQAVGGWARPNLYMRKICGTTGNASEIACHQAASGATLSELNVTALAAGTYYLWVDAYVTGSTANGPFVLMGWLTNPPAAPANHTCSLATAMTFDGTGLATATGDTTNAPNDSAGTCDGSLGGEVVYKFTLTQAQKVVATVARATGNTTFMPVVYLRNACPSVADTSEVTCAVQSSGTATATVNSLAAGTYYVYVDGQGSISSSSTNLPYGPFTLTVQTAAPVTGPTNESCAFAAPLAFVGNTATATGDTTGGINETSGTCGSTSTADVVYSFTTAQAKKVIATVAPATGSNLRPAVYLRRACGSVLAADELGCSAPSSTPYNAVVTKRYAPAGTYYVWVDASTTGTNGSGPFNLTVQLDTAVPPPTNDTCATATALTFSSGTATITGSTIDSLNDASSTSSSCTASTTPDVVYSFTVAQDQSATISVTATDNTTYHPGWFVRKNACTSTASADEVKCAGGSSSTTTPPYLATGTIKLVSPGSTYYVFVDSYSTSYPQGDFTLTVQLGAPVYPPINDTCANAVPLTYNVVAYGEILPTFNADYGAEPMSTVCNITYKPKSPDAVFSYTPSTTGSFTITLVADAGYDPLLWYNSGTCGGNGMTCLGSVDGTGSGGTETLTVSGVAGTAYYIYASNYSATSSTRFGTFTIKVQ